MAASVQASSPSTAALSPATGTSPPASPLIPAARFRPGTEFIGLKRGVVSLGGTKFDIRGFIFLAGQAEAGAGRSLPARVEGIKVGRKCARLHFLQGATFETTDGVQAGSYILHYADGQRRELPLIYGRDLRNWWTIRSEPLEATEARVVWTGEDPQALENHCSLRLFKSTRDNPLPDAEITSIDFVSSMSQVSPFLVALTVESGPQRR